MSGYFNSYKMKPHIKQVCLFSITIILSGCATTKNNSKGKLPFANNKVVAHRGAWKKNKLPQNAIASLKEAIRLQCTGTDYCFAVFKDHPQWIEEAANNYILLSGRTVSDAETMHWLLEKGFNFITTSKHGLLLHKVKDTLK
jgi:hypothetical protein